MTLIRREGESQRAFVERELREQGRIATYDVLYDTVFTNGRRASITRLAAIIHGLRAEGWSIETRDENGSVAVYTLRQTVEAWTCTGCGAKALQTPEPLLGGMGEAYCLTCRKRQPFRLQPVAA